MKAENLAVYILQNLDVIWTFTLLIARYTGLFFSTPGIGQGAEGLRVRAPAIIVLTLASLPTMKAAPLPVDAVIMTVAIGSEFLLGFLIGMIPKVVVSGVQIGAQLASTSMGLSASNLFDPTTGSTSSDLARIQSDLTILMFLILGGHYTLIEAVSGLSGQFTPGNLVFDTVTADLFVQRCGEIFHMGALISAPVIVALLLTQFVMGIISRAVPTVNIFIVSFPLTVGIGVILTIIALPEVMKYVLNQFSATDNIASAIIENMTDLKVIKP
jgi:flagellar biosynthetic protein FliR